MSLEGFKERLRKACRSSGLPDPQVIEQIGNAIKFSIKVREGLEIRIYYNSEIETINTAVIAGRKRIFGINGYPRRHLWHRHPFAQPQKHIPIKPLKLEEMVAILSKVVRRRRR